MNQAQYFKTFASADEAGDSMKAKNRAAQRAGSGDIFVLVDGPEDDFVVMDLEQAVANGLLYSWEI